MKQPVRRREMTDKTNYRRTLDSAVVVINPEYDAEADVWKGYRLGATDGGVNFNAEINYRSREYDGFAGFNVVGDKVVESAEVTATVQLAELTDSMIQKAIKADIEVLADGKKLLKPQRNIRPEDYIDTVGLVNYLPNGEFMMIKMYNVLITSPFNVQTEHNGDFAMEVELTAHIDLTKGIDSLDDLPFDVITPEVMSAVDEDGDMPTVLGGE